MYYGTGRRKKAIARVWLKPGQGRIIINKRPLEQYFPVEMLQTKVRKPLETVALAGNYDVVVNVNGGGVSGQAGAVSLGIARALLQADNNLRVTLRRGGFLTRDPRMKERRKYGLKKARKAPQFSKR